MVRAEDKARAENPSRSSYQRQELRQLILRRHRISLEQLREIAYEGQRKQWPLPAQER